MSVGPPIPACGMPSPGDSRFFPACTVGGTFNTLHAGHKEYLRIAFAISSFVYISLTSDDYATSLKSYEVRPFDVRHKEIESFLAEEGFGGRFYVHSLESGEGLTEFILGAALDLAVVEPRYLDVFRALNKRRRALEKSEYCILLKPRTSVGGVDVSSTALQELCAGE